MLWLYTSYYPNRENADIFKYYDDGNVISSVFDEDPLEFLKLVSGVETINDKTAQILSATKYWDRSPSLAGLNDNRLIIKFNAVLSLFSLNNIATHMLFASFLAFMGLTFLMKFFLKLISDRTPLIFIVVYFSPSLLFWTSGILKEAFMIFGLGGLIYHAMCIVQSKVTLSKLIIMHVFILILFSSKLYVAILIMPGLFAFLWNYKHDDGKAILRYLAMNLLFLGLVMNLPQLLDIDILNVLVQKQIEFKCLAEWMNAGSVVYIPELSDTWTSLIIAAPFALFNTFLRPHLFDELNALSLLAMLETLGFIALIAVTIIHRKPVSTKTMNLFLFSLNFAILLGLLIGWTTPVLGAIVRYRVPMMIFILVSLISMLDLEKNRIFARLNKEQL